MVIIGTDSHKRSHTVVAVDANGRALADKTVAATPAGHLELLRWAARFVERSWRTAATCRAAWRPTC
ncbi:MAG: IS110 family transposase, partial [Candidatus Limnocylindria bacterium]